MGRTRWMVAAAAVLLAGCSSTSSSGAPPATKAPMPAFEVTADDGKFLTVEVSTADPAALRRVFDQVRATTEGDSRQVAIVCVGDPAYLVDAAWATTQRGLVQTGLGSTDEVRFEVHADRPCPVG